jgi:hypothetical protein
MRRLAVVLVLPLLVAGLVACGDDDDSTSASTSPSGSAFCRKARVLDEKYQDLGKPGPSGVPRAEAFEAAADGIDDTVEDAPASIKPDLQTMARGLRKTAEVLGSVDLSDPKALADPANAQKLQQLENEMQGLARDVQAATTRVAKYVSDKCGIDVGDTSTTAG